MQTAGCRRRFSGWFEGRRSSARHVLPVDRGRARVEALERRALLSVTAPVTATAPAEVTGPIAETATDLALGRPAFASSRYDDLALYDAARVTDGNPLTRWASQREPGGRSWVYVDLGDAYAVSRVTLNWEQSRPS